MKQLLKEKIKDRILDYIHEKKVNIGSRLPSEKEFSKLFNVNHLTVRAALSILADEGYVEKRHRSGTYLKKHHEHFVLAEENNLVAILVEMKGHFYSPLYAELCSKLEKSNYIPVSMSYDNLLESGCAEKLFERMKALNIRKLVASHNALIMNENVRQQLYLNRTQTPYWDKIIWINGDFHSKDKFYGDYVIVDSMDILKLAIKHLAEQGHRRIALLTNNWDVNNPYYYFHTTHVRNYCEIMNSMGLSDGIKIIQGNYLNNELTNKLTRLFSDKDHPTAFIGTIDYRGVCVLKAAASCDLKVPDDIMVVGNINTPWASEFDLTSVDHNIPSIVGNIMSLLKQSHPIVDPAEIKYVKPSLVIRKSTKRNKNRIPSDTNRESITTNLGAKCK